MPTYRDVEYEIEREKREKAAFRYDFVLYVAGEEVVTADQLDQRGHDGPADGGPQWNSLLELYAEAYIDKYLSGP